MGTTKRLGYWETIDYYAEQSAVRRYKGGRVETLAQDCREVAIIAKIFGWYPIDVARSFERRWDVEDKKAEPLTRATK